MIDLDIPGRTKLEIKSIVFDVNGTLAKDGELIPGVKDAISRIRNSLDVYLLTANTHGRQKSIDNILGFSATILKKGDEIIQKKEFVERLGSEKIIAVGQGSNDSGMLKSAAIGICVLSSEGTAIETLLSADIVVSDIFTAFNLIENPARMIATLRK